MGRQARHRAEIRPEHRAGSRYFWRRGDSPDAGASPGSGALGSDARADARDASSPERDHGAVARAKGDTGGARLLRGYARAGTGAQ